MVQWFGLSAFTARAQGSILDQRTKILQALWHGGKQANKIPTLLGKTAQRNMCKSTNLTHVE